MQSQPPLILLIGDDPLLQELLTLGLAAYGYNLHTANALDSAKQFLKKTPADLIVLDMLMPALAVLKFLYGLRQQSKQMTPVLALSAAEWPGTEQDLLEAGASAVVFKPIELESLVAKIRHCLPPESVHIQ